MAEIFILITSCVVVRFTNGHILNELYVVKKGVGNKFSGNVGILTPPKEQLEICHAEKSVSHVACFPRHRQSSFGESVL